MGWLALNGTAISYHSSFQGSWIIEEKRDRNIVGANHLRMMRSWAADENRLLSFSNEYTSQLQFQYVSLYLQINVGSIPHQRSFFLHKIETSQKSITSQTAKGSWSRAPNHNWYIYSTIPILKAQGSFQKRGQKDFKTQKNRMSVIR